ncbi:MAG: hypothetical protein R2747_05035 [Pyrinomonadaceae bacterium]
MRKAVLLFIFTFCLAGTASNVFGQFEAQTPNGRERKEPLPQNIQETLAKQRIENEQKEFEEMVKRGEDALKLSEEIQKSFDKNNKLTQSDQEKLKDLEKLLKKIRSDLGGDDDDEEDLEIPKSTGNAIEFLKDSTEKLYDEIKKTTRHTISAAAIQGSNTVLRIVKFLRLHK